MQKKLMIIASLVAVLGLVAAAAVALGQASPAQMAAGDPDLLVPGTTYHADAKWQAQPVKGAPAVLPWSNVRVNTDTGTAAQNEPFAAVDPHNAQHIVIGANNWAPGSGQFVVYAYVSFDGGQTWQSSQPYVNRNASRLNAADPTVAFGADGSVYFAFVAFSPAPGAVAVSRSIDGGLTWASQSWATSFAGEAADKPAIAATPSGLQLFYQGSALYARSSADNGSTWSAAATIDVGGRNAAPVVDAAGKVSVFYATANSIRMARATGGRGGYSVSTVSSVTPLQPRAAQYRASIYPAAGVAPNGTLYVAWADGRNAGHGNDIMLSQSKDGRTWTAARVVNTDSGNADQLMPALGVGADGSVTVAWLDTRNDASNINYDVYMARATDGIHFGANTRVTSVSSNPNNDPDLQGSLIGDYFAMAVSSGTVYPVWTDTRNNNEDIFIAPIHVSGITN